MLIIVSCRHLKNSKFRKRLSLNSPYLPKDRSSNRNLMVINLPPWVGVLATRRTDSLQDRRLDIDTTPKLCHKLSYLPFILLRAYSSFLKTIYSPLKGLHSLLLPLLRWHLILNSEATSLSYSFFPGYLPCMHEVIYVNKLVHFFLLLICLLLQGVSAQNWRRVGRKLFYSLTIPISKGGNRKEGKCGVLPAYPKPHRLTPRLENNLFSSMLCPPSPFEVATSPTQPSHVEPWKFCVFFLHWKIRQHIYNPLRISWKLWLGVIY